MKLITMSPPKMQHVKPASFSFRKFSFFCIIILAIVHLPAHAQVKKNHPNWWFGMAGGANLNRYKGNTRVLNADIHPASGFDRGHAYGAYVAAFIEYHRPGSFWGIMLQQGLDNRNGKFENAGNEFDAKISYFTVEPSLVIMIPKTGFHVYAGPRFGFLWGSEFTFKEPNRPIYPDEQVNYPAYIRNLRKNPISMQVGIGYDIRLNSGSASTQFIVAPFATYLPSLDQNIRTIETMKLTSFRAGIVLKAGRVSKN